MVGFLSFSVSTPVSPRPSRVSLSPGTPASSVSTALAARESNLVADALLAVETAAAVLGLPTSVAGGNGFTLIPGAGSKLLADAAKMRYI